MKRYYSSTKNYYKRRRIWPIFKLISAIFGCFYKGKVEVRYSEPLPEGESIVLTPNHSREYGPLTVFFNYKRHMRLWLNSNLIIVKDIPNHMMKDFFINEKGIKKVLIKLFCFLISPILSAAMKSIEVIPVYRDTRIKTTLNKTNETLIEGKDVVIFPESNVSDPSLKYVNLLQEGFVFSALNYYNETGRRLKYYPVYVCKKLGIMSIGKHIEFNPETNFHDERERICKYITEEIERLGSELPPHEVVPYGEIPESREALEEYNERKSKYSH